MLDAASLDRLLRLALQGRHQGRNKQEYQAQVLTL